TPRWMKRRRFGAVGRTGFEAVMGRSWSRVREAVTVRRIAHVCNAGRVLAVAGTCAARIYAGDR
ncbi:TPA: hypothetical protein ACT5CG_006337, partial [Burkholderia cenocepacia]